MSSTPSNAMDSIAGNVGAVHIGALAAEIGLNPKTIRFYEEIGLLPAPERSPTGYRLYSSADRGRLHFIIRAKEFGFTLEEIGDVFALSNDGKEPCSHVVDLIDEKIRGTDQQLRELLDYRERLFHVRTVAGTRMHDEAYVCGIIEHDDTISSGHVAPPPQPPAHKLRVRMRH